MAFVSSRNSSSGSISATPNIFFQSRFAITFVKVGFCGEVAHCAKTSALSLPGTWFRCGAKDRARLYDIAGLAVGLVKIRWQFQHTLRAALHADRAEELAHTAFDDADDLPILQRVEALLLP